MADKKQLTEKEKQEVAQNTEIELKVNVNEFNVIVSSLGQMPHDRVRNVIDKIMKQATDKLNNKKK